MSENLSYSAKSEVANLIKRRTRVERLKIALSKAPISAWFGMAVLFVYFFAAIFAPLIAPHGEAEIFPVAYAPWGDGHIFGTDQIGRDIFSRIIYAARNTIGICLLATFIALGIGTVLGIIAALDRKYLDQLLSRIVDTLMAIPVMIFTFILLSVFGPTNFNLIVILGILESTRFFRISRSVAVGQVVLEYVEVARLRGENLPYIIFKEILPNIASPLIIEFGLRFIFIIFTISSLSFLGIGIQPPSADWASMVRENAILIQYAQYDLTAGLTPLIPAFAIALLCVSINFVVDWYLYITSGLKDDVK
ncbi:ABC transporter permease [Pelagibacteraceae bacterium]|jgi:peptide/nickel transport system permease protein|nr:ABC transporter permease [Pelagibacteraceae bacterium]|tara:strand:- start:12 stop:932 length:921 start_codon:yes stop_codon:yes gene_type:complete